MIDTYRRNKFCPCTRCRMNCMMGPVILVTLGVLFLMENYHLSRGSTFMAVLLIVIGAVKLLQSTAPTDGHQQPYPFYTGTVPPATATAQTGQVENNG